jgi:uncharacterized repeat protein (TIGR03837 family)
MKVDLFCRVVDNFGDAGVCWRLARQLASEYRFDVRLFVDAPESLARMAPGIDPSLDEQRLERVCVLRWRDDIAAYDAPDAVIEGFGAGLPSDVLAAMGEARRKPVWINLEYLSAEDWIETAHGLPSPQPSLPLTRHFWFPGFTPSTGGVLRERGLLKRREAFRTDAKAQAEAWRALGAEPPAPGSIVVSLFCYENTALPALLDRWSSGDAPIACFVAEGVAASSLSRWAGDKSPLRAGTRIARGNLALAVVPFVAQDVYDRVLWLCDVNFVRGEDSFVRAQWASRAFAWHIYPQQDEAHQVKLEAFLSRYAGAMEPPIAEAVSQFTLAWNRGNGSETARNWDVFVAARAEIATATEAWARRLARQPDLASALVKRVRELL